MTILVQHLTPHAINRELEGMRKLLKRALQAGTVYRDHIRYLRFVMKRIDKLSASIEPGQAPKRGPKPKVTAETQVRPFPDISPAAWVVLLRIGVDQPVTLANAVALVGPYLAAEAITELDTKHLVEEGYFTPLAKTLRKWDRNARAAHG
jgi:hypothetical protein